jgi:hypothetical protein
MYINTQGEKQKENKIIKRILQANVTPSSILNKKTTEPGRQP